MLLTELFRHWTFQVFAPGTLLRTKYNAFKELLAFDEQCLDRIADIEEIAYGQVQADWARVAWLAEELGRNCAALVDRLRAMSPTRYVSLPEYLNKIIFYVRMGLDLDEPDLAPPHVIGLTEAADLPNLAGGKAHKVGLVAAETYLRVPPGFAVTANAFNYYIEYNGLRPLLDERLRQVSLNDPETLNELCGEMQALVLEGEVPDDMAAAIRQRAEDLTSGGRLLAVRSSALGEDSELSFAGQYESVLGVGAEGVLDAYKQVLASKYCMRAVSYRLTHGIPDARTPMAVLVMAMVPAQAAGVVYTHDTDRARAVQGVMSIYAVPGAGERLVSGRATPQIWCLTCEAEPVLLQDAGMAPVLTDAAVAELAKAAYEVEELFDAPQDIEWVLNPEGELYVVQARPFRGEPGGEGRSAPVAEPTAEILLDDATVAAGGAGFGPVAHLRAEAGLGKVPRGSVLVVPALWPALAGLAPRLAGVVAETGSRASHFASVAREFGLPVLVGAGDPYAALTEGRSVTVDAASGRVFAGRVTEVLTAAPRADRANYALTRLAAVLPHMVKLNLTDPEAENFSPEGCRSLHDVVRLCHEKGVAEMFSLVGKGGRGMGRAKKLETRLPVTIYVLDVGDGLFETARDKQSITPDDIKCPCMWSLWWGLTNENTPWSDKLPHMDWEQFDRVSAGLISTDSRLLASYAVLAQDYVHLMVRFGYHFSQVDALCGDEPRTNYVNFRFKGGGGLPEQRALRLAFIHEVLAGEGFTVTTRGDMLDAQFGRQPEAVIQRKLTLLGRLLARTRLMDLGLKGPSEIPELVREFLKGLTRTPSEF
ncbi:MAG: PEP/pyruvate-binding domain-containing protein [Desulfovibrionaceae bacterium]